MQFFCPNIWYPLSFCRSVRVHPHHRLGCDPPFNQTLLGLPAFNLILSSNGKTVATTAGWVSLPRGHSSGTSQPAAHPPPPAPNTAHSLCTVHCISVHQDCAPEVHTALLCAIYTMAEYSMPFHGVQNAICTSFGAVFSVADWTH